MKNKAAFIDERILEQFTNCHSYFSGILPFLIPTVLSLLCVSFLFLPFLLLFSSFLLVKLRQFYMKYGLLYLLQTYGHMLTYQLINYFFALLFILMERKISGSPSLNTSSEIKNNCPLHIALGKLEYRHYTNNSGNSGHMILMSLVRLMEQQGKSQNTGGNSFLTTRKTCTF